MWYEILPALTVVAAGIYLPTLGISYLHNIIWGIPAHRSFRIALDRSLFLRDESLCDHPVTAGLEGLNNIPDE